MSKICVFVYNNCKTDARVLKEAKTLADQGHEVKIIAILDKLTEPYQERDGFTIVRVEKNPLHYRILKSFRYFFAGIKRTIRRGFSLLRAIVEAGIMLVLRVLGVFNGKSKETGEEQTHGDELRDSPYWEFITMLRKPPSGGRLKAVISEHPIKFWLVGWQFFIVYQILRVIWRVVRGIGNLFRSILYEALKRFLMIFHRPLCYMDYYRRSLAIVKQDPAEIYHGHDLNTLPVACMSGNRTKGKVVYDSHELYTEISTFTGIERKLYQILEKKYAPQADRVITVNESIAQELSERYKIDVPTVVMNCPVVEGRVNADTGDLLREKVGITSKEPLILYQGGFAPNRGLENLVEAAQSLERGIMVFMGWGMIEQKLVNLTKELKLTDRVFFTGPVPQEVLLDYSKSADVGVIPYRAVGLNNYYTSPNKLFEYINAGVPIVGSNFPELVRVIDAYKIGTTFNPEDPKDIARAINEALRDDVQLQQMKDNTKEAAKRYTWENESKKLVELYQGLENETAH